MTETETRSRREETKRYLVKCDGCSFERTADGHDEAVRIGNAHRQETEHELVAVEMPRSTASG